MKGISERRVAKYTDQKIAELISERKPLPEDWQLKMRPKLGRGIKQGECEVQGDNGTKFKVIVKQNNFCKDNFSAILGCTPKGSNKLFRLRRYDGNHSHTNKLEKETFHNAYHIHIATERYQEHGVDEDGYAETTERYSNLNEAFQCMLEDCNLILPDKQQLPLLGWI